MDGIELDFAAKQTCSITQTEERLATSQEANFTLQKMEEFNSFMNSPLSDFFKIFKLVQFINDRLYFITLTDKDVKSPQNFKDWKSSNGSNVFYVCLQKHLPFGELCEELKKFHLGLIYHFVNIVKAGLKDYKKVVFCAHVHNISIMDSTLFLIGAYMIIEENWTPQRAYTLILELCYHKPIIFRYRSKTRSLNKFCSSISVESCLNALYKAKWYRFFDFDDFDLQEFEKYRVLNTSKMNWIIPGTMLALASPLSQTIIDKINSTKHPPSYYYQYFKENNVKHIVRLNGRRFYNAQKTFVAVAKINHVNLDFEDGGLPSDKIIDQFFNICDQYIDDSYDVEYSNNDMSESKTNTNFNSEASSGASPPKLGSAVAVHCKAGLGRTGCLISSYIVKHWQFTADEAIVWVRLCRPGSVYIQQHEWLTSKEDCLKACGNEWRISKSRVDKYQRFTYGVYSGKRHTSTSNTHEYVDPPPQSFFSYIHVNPFTSDSDAED